MPIAAAALVRAWSALRFGLITTNSLRQTFNRRVVEAHLKGASLRLPAATPAAAGSSFPAAGASLPPGGDTPPPPGSSFRQMGAAPISSGEDPATGKGHPAADGGVLPPNGGGPKTATFSVAPLKTGPLSHLLAILDHSSVDTAEGAAVGIAMTVGAAGAHPGDLRIATAGKPITPAELAKHFLRANPADLAEILETPATLGKGAPGGETFAK